MFQFSHVLKAILYFPFEYCIFLGTYYIVTKLFEVKVLKVSNFCLSAIYKI